MSQLGKHFHDSRNEQHRMLHTATVGATQNVLVIKNTLYMLYIKPIYEFLKLKHGNGTFRRRPLVRFKICPIGLAHFESDRVRNVPCFSFRNSYIGYTNRLRSIRWGLARHVWLSAVGRLTNSAKSMVVEHWALHFAFWYWKMIADTYCIGRDSDTLCFAI